MYRLEYLEIADLDLAEAEDDLFAYSLPAYNKLREAIKKQETLLVDNPFMYQVKQQNHIFGVCFCLMVISVFTMWTKKPG